MRLAENIQSELGNEQRQVRDAYGVVLVLVLASTMMLIAAGAPLPSGIVALAALLQVGALLITLKVSGFSRASRTVGSVTFSLLFVAALLGVFYGSNDGRVAALMAWILLAAVTIVSVGRRLRTYKRVTVQMVMGLLVVYVLLGVTFGLTYALIEYVYPGAFAQGQQGISGSVYFSFVTLSTLGYGDVSPGIDIMRSLAVAEAIVGQLYLVSIVSVAASRLGSVRERIRPPEDAEDAE
jgi:hypothetical protein